MQNFMRQLHALGERSWPTRPNLARRTTNQTIVFSSFIPHPSSEDGGVADSLKGASEAVSPLMTYGRGINRQLESWRSGGVLVGGIEPEDVPDVRAARDFPVNESERDGNFGPRGLGSRAFAPNIS
jgi:hypothetical protein